jgi:hypothetical protein
VTENHSSPRVADQVKWICGAAHGASSIAPFSHLSI